MRGRLFWGVILIAFGVLLLLDQAGILPGNAYAYLWPMMLIGAGLIVLYNATRRGTLTIVDDSIPLQAAHSARVAIKHAAGTLHVAGGAPTDALMTGQFAGGVARNSVTSGDRVDLTLKVPDDAASSLDWLGGRRGFEWDVHLNSAVPLDLAVDTGASRTSLDLTDVQVGRLDLHTGASTVDVTLPAHAGLTEAHIEGGVATVNVHVPDGVAARIHGNIGLGGLSVDETRFTKHDGAFESPDFATALNRVVIGVQGGLGAVTVR